MGAFSKAWLSVQNQAIDTYSTCAEIILIAKLLSKYFL